MNVTNKLYAPLFTFINETNNAKHKQIFILGGASAANGISLERFGPIHWVMMSKAIAIVYSKWIECLI